MNTDPKQANMSHGKKTSTPSCPVRLAHTRSTLSSLHQRLELASHLVSLLSDSAFKLHQGFPKRSSSATTLVGRLHKCSRQRSHKLMGAQLHATETTVSVIIQADAVDDSLQNRGDTKVQPLRQCTSRSSGQMQPAAQRSPLNIPLLRLCSFDLPNLLRHVGD